MSEPVLVVSDLTKKFGALTAVDGVSFEAQSGEILGIAGPNGSGKSTLFNAITRVPFAQTSGVVLFKGAQISNLANNEIAKRGIARTFQRESVFGNLSSIDNVLVTIEQTNRASAFAQKIALAEQALDLVGFPATLHNWQAGRLPVYLRKLVMIAGAVALDPAVLLLDEPASGLTVSEIDKMRALITHLNELGMTILLVEHVLSLLMEVSDRLMVLDQGRVIALGDPATVVANPTVIEAYLGTPA
ncbi:ABC transporter ATP-binding protein [Roseobacter sp. EG26]|uniref:ABC transporter ATP-binding protein n=1 Tax=Roseobacter sp. EG26 TaxID=3412477 RepID=UPI003CE51F74